MADLEIIHSEAMYGAKSKQPLVKINWGDKEMVVHTKDAKRVAYDLLDTAHAADGDAFIFDWLQEKLDVPIEKAATILAEFRDYRVRKNGEN